MSDDKFHGRGFKETPIEGAEAAKHRHMYKDLNEGWIKLDEHTVHTVQSLGTVTQAIRIIANMIKYGGPTAAVMFAAGAYLRSQGLI